MKNISFAQFSYVSKYIVIFENYSHSCKSLLLFQGNTPVLIIGHHILYGKTVSLEKPFAVLEKCRTSDSTEYIVKALVKHKLLFRTRPKPIIANVPKVVQSSDDLLFIRYCKISCGHHPKSIAIKIIVTNQDVCWVGGFVKTYVVEFLHFNA